MIDHFTILFWAIRSKQLNFLADGFFSGDCIFLKPLDDGLHRGILVRLGLPPH